MKKILRLKSPCYVFIDWANVYGWKKSLKKVINPQRLYKYLKNYKEIKSINFYYGTDKHPKSKKFITKIKKLRYKVNTKPVKYILTAKIGDQRIYRRKCDFDMEISISVHKVLNKTKSFIFFTGDGDFAPLYELLIKKKKQVIVIYAKNHIGREIWSIGRGLFKIQITHLGL